MKTCSEWNAECNRFVITNIQTDRKLIISIEQK